MNTDSSRRYDRAKLAKRRREIEVRRKIFMMVLTFVLTVGFFFCYQAIMSKANTSLEDMKFKYYTSITVKYGDSLWTLAKQYSDSQYGSLQEYVDEVVRINSLKEDTVNAGQYLIVPYYSQNFVGADMQVSAVEEL